MRNRQEFKVGDLVRIRDWDEMVKEFGYKNGEIPTNDVLVFVDQMKYLCGRQFTISELSPSLGDEYIKVYGWSDNTSERKWTITLEMIEHCLIEDNFDPTEELNEFLNTWR